MERTGAVEEGKGDLGQISAAGNLHVSYEQFLSYKEAVQKAQLYFRGLLVG
jgi:hypothetical protein